MPLMTEEKFLQLIGKNHPKDDLSILSKAYRYGERAHRGQQRKSGDPYFIHPIEVGLLLNDMRLDIPSIVSGLLHDTVEDTAVSLDGIRKEFGEEVAFLVDGVTKLNKIVFTNREDKQAENFRKMLVAMSKDIRVLLIKLADRLNNMRTIKSLSVKRRVAIAEETLDIYAPLANRLGMSQMKMELQDLSISVLKPDLCADISRKLKLLTKNKQTYIRRVENKLKEKLDQYFPKYESTYRLKHLFSIYHKMLSQNLDFEQVHDLLGFRIIVDSLEQCYEALGLIHSLWKPLPGRVKDYIAMPKANRYQSLHTTVVCEEGQRVEFQIRTFAMHDIAEKGIAAHWNYKENNIVKAKDTEKFEWLRQLLTWKNELQDSDEFLDTLKIDLFTNEVYVFTPKGDVKELPYGSTPVDLAYAIHSAVGDKCTGGKVNDRIVPLTYVLQSGDIVEILTDPRSHPNKDWLKFVKTSRAQANIRRFIRDEQRARSIHLGRDLLEKECARFDLNLNRFLRSKKLQAELSHHALADTDSLLAAIGYGKVSPTQIITKVFPEQKLIAKATDVSSEKQPTSLLQQIFKKVASRSRNLVTVSGLNDVLVTFGKCCNPLPGESIIGFVTRGRGVRVHTKDCSKAIADDPDRRIDVEWSRARAAHDLRTVKVQILSQDKPGMLSKITKVISDQGINISGAQIRTTRDAKAINLIDVTVPTLDQLQTVMHALQKIDGVISVDRVRQ